MEEKTNKCDEHLVRTIDTGMLTNWILNVRGTVLEIQETGDVLFNHKKIDVEKDLALAFRDLVDASQSRLHRRIKELEMFCMTYGLCPECMKLEQECDCGGGGGSDE